MDAPLHILAALVIERRNLAFGGVDHGVFAALYFQKLNRCVNTNHLCNLLEEGNVKVFPRRIGVIDLANQGHVDDVSNAPHAKPRHEILLYIILLFGHQAMIRRHAFGAEESDVGLEVR